MKEIVKTNIPGYVKNIKSGAVINKNEKEYNDILEKRKLDKELADIKNRFSLMECELIKIRNILGDILNK